VRRQMLVAVPDIVGDPDRLDQLSSALRRELLDLGVDDVTTVSNGTPPPGSRAVDAASAGMLLVAFQESLPMITGILGLVRSWWASTRDVGTVEISIGDQTLKLGAASPDQQDRLVDEFVAALKRLEQPPAPPSSVAP
jgi:hypothetical protein